MKPESILKLREHPQFHELVVFLAAELAKVDTLEGLAPLSFTERAYETTSRLRTKEALTLILEPLIGAVDKPTGINPAEYAA